MAAPSATGSSRPASDGSVERQCRPPTRTLPFLSASGVTHRTREYGAAGRPDVANRSSWKSCDPGPPLMWCSSSAMRMHPSSGRALHPATSHALGTGTNRLRLRVPTLLSTLPSSLPE